MSSPIHQSEDLDPALRYAPRWARDRASLAGRPLPPPAPRPLRRARPDFSGDRAMVELQRQLMLDPDAIPEPAVDDARTLKPIVLRLSGVMGLAALIAWGIVSLPGMKRAGELMPIDVRTPAMTGNSVALVQAQSADAVPTSREGTAVNDPAPSPAPPSNPLIASIAPTTAIAPSQPAAASLPATMPSQLAVASAAPATAPAPTSDANAPHIANAEISAMIKRGKDLLTSGDIASARLLLRRAADAGSAEAALTLGATFDPLIIRQLGVIGMTPDIAQARRWYQRASDLGSASAMSQLAKLEQTQ